MSGVTKIFVYVVIPLWEHPTNTSLFQFMTWLRRLARMFRTCDNLGTTFCPEIGGQQAPIWPDLWAILLVTRSLKFFRLVGHIYKAFMMDLLLVLMKPCMLVCNMIPQSYVISKFVCIIDLSSILWKPGNIVGRLIIEKNLFYSKVQKLWKFDKRNSHHEWNMISHSWKTFQSVHWKKINTRRVVT